MDLLNEIINYNNPLLALKIYEASPRGIKPLQGSWHYHKELEILVILEGSMELVIKEKVYQLKAGDLFLIGPMEVHLDCNLDVRYIVFQFDVNKFFEPSLAPFIHSLLNPHMSLSKLNYIFQEDESVRKEVASTVIDIHRESIERPRGYEVAIAIKVKHILLTILRNDYKHELDRHSSLEIERLRPVLQYISANLAEEISVERCCQLLNLNYYYFLKLFKKTIGITFVEYVQHERIKVAERILLTEQLAIEEVAELAGFHNMGHFYKTFQKFHDCTPNAYKKQYKH
ncbi:AraC family transcriptional regulator [Bacillus massiliigorillae]|uniref:AraC family transcriptional regulator n=1 Tax=Bacillus massiliigorillae TaxID=1243664 RepID=UPI00039D713E|nr:AraC family transcriptional regulator [Bacillus massiliigorillae]